MTIAKFHGAPVGLVLKFLASEEPGVPFEYASGWALPEQPTEGIVAIRRAYNRGEIDLVQRRNTVSRVPGVAYLAIKRRKRAMISDAGKFTPLHLTA